VYVLGLRVNTASMRYIKGHGDLAMSSSDVQDPSDRQRNNPVVFKQPAQIALVVGFCVVILILMQVSEQYLESYTN
jgi:hypothetical protein